MIITKAHLFCSYRHFCPLNFRFFIPAKAGIQQLIDTTGLFAALTLRAACGVQRASRLCSGLRWNDGIKSNNIHVSDFANLSAPQ
ncbi:MAG TPA: hypothetical protein ENI97_05855 [Gammaproteobacteria bacterium]|nr:hypothetical protein [Gammaproteobacteria bacterium]